MLEASHLKHHLFIRFLCALNYNLYMMYCISHWFVNRTFRCTRAIFCNTIFDQASRDAYVAATASYTRSMFE